MQTVSAQRHGHPAALTHELLLSAGESKTRGACRRARWIFAVFCKKLQFVAVAALFLFIYCLL